MVRDRAHLLTFRALPDPDLVSTGGSERVLRVVIGERSDALLVMSKRLQTVTFPDVPELDHFVMRA